MANERGKRYGCPQCGMEILVERAGEGPVQCHQEMQPVRLPAYKPSKDAAVAIV